MRRTSFVAAAIASAAAIALFAGIEPASAQKGGHGGGHAMSGGGARSGGARSFSGSASARSAPRAQGFVNRGGSGRHVGHARGGRVLGYAPFVGGYAYGGGCAYYYQRATATGSSYWWQRYYDCAGD
jgi:hypothetical protein